MHQYSVAAVVLAATASASAAPERTLQAAFSAEQLKSAYLDCDRAASGGLVGTVEAIDCSLVHEELKERVFRGDFDRLLSWWKAEQAAQRPLRDSAQGHLPRPQEGGVGRPFGPEKGVDADRHGSPRKNVTSEPSTWPRVAGDQ